MLGRRAVASPLGLAPGRCISVLTSRPSEDLRGRGGTRCIRFWAVGWVWAQGQAGVIAGALPPPHHLLAICLSKSSPASAAASARDGAGPGSLAPRSLPNGPTTLLLPQTLKPRRRLRQPGGTATCVWPSRLSPLRAGRGFLEGEKENAVWGGIWAYPKPEQHRIAFREPLCAMETAILILNLLSTFSIPGLTLRVLYSRSHIMFTTTLCDWYDCYYCHFQMAKADLESGLICPRLHSSKRKRQQLTPDTCRPKPAPGTALLGRAPCPRRARLQT